MSERVRVFVSYASLDRAFAERLVNDLKAAGAEVWWDVSGIDEGDFLGKINQALQQCQWLVLVLTPNAVASKWVNLEVNAAIHRRQQGFMQGVLPLLAAPVQLGTVPPMWDNLHPYDAVSDYSGEVTRLIRTLGISGASAELPWSQPVMPVIPPTYVAPADCFPPRLAELGYRITFLNGAELILPPLCDVPAGPFLMGSDQNKDKGAPDDEQPQHSVMLGSYQIAQYPVTVAEYASFVRATGRDAPTSENGNQLQVSWQTQLRERLEHPIVMVSSQDAAAYAEWLAERTQQPWRLPSEAEWERAARWDDTTGSSRIYPWGDAFDTKRCNTGDGGKGTTTPIGAYPSGGSPCGALDMAGNVWDWTSSEFKSYPYVATDGREQGKSSEWRVVRGGSWYGPGRVARTAYRGYDDPGDAVFDIGFRLVLAAPIT